MQNFLPTLYYNIKVSLYVKLYFNKIIPLIKIILKIIVLSKNFGKGKNWKITRWKNGIKNSIKNFPFKKKKIYLLKNYTMLTF